MELSNQKKLAKHIFRLLKVNEIVFSIGRTNKGNLGLKFQANSDDFEIYLDAVPLATQNMLTDDNNIELKKMLEKYWFDGSEPAPVLSSQGHVYTLDNSTGASLVYTESITNEPEPPKKPRGRPKKK